VRMFPLTLNRQPAGIAVGPGGDIWFTQYAWYNAGRSPDPTAPPPDPATIGRPAIGRISPDGTVTEFALPTAEGNRMGAPDMGSVPRGIIAGPDGAMWFTESGADQIGRITADGTITEYPLPSRNQVHAFPDGIALGPDRAIWFAETLYGALGRIDVATGAITEHPIEPRGVAGAGLLAKGPDGAFWFGGWDASLGRMTTAGKTSVFPLSPKAQQVNALIAGPDGRLWVADDRSAAILRVTTKGAVSQLLAVPGVPARDWEALGGLAAGNDRSVWLATPSSNRILRISCVV
ncbi:MAG: virginiamycin B lyase family protein, partial [Acidimicrobiia bacterium]